MKILLLGEYSNVHATLAEGLRALGHQVTVASNGDFWKNYPRDIDLARTPNHWGGIRLMAKVATLLPSFRGYDVVQLINPMFLELKAERILPIYRYLRRHNSKMFLGAFGMDYYWVNECTQRRHLRYSDFNIGDQLRTNVEATREQKDWLGTPKEKLNRIIADDCDGIITGLYEYWSCYEPHFPDKTTFIPFPIRPATSFSTEAHHPVRIFIGINRERSSYKGTDIMLQAAREVEAHHPDLMKLQVVESVPFSLYTQLMENSDAILDQLYAYTPSMNPLEAMKKGIICIGGGEPENYEIIGETELRPIINVEPTKESVVSALEQLVLHPEAIPKLKRQSVEYISRHHDYLKVARQYLDFWNSM